MMSPTTEETEAPPVVTKPQTASQSLGTGATGAAAIGSVVALGFAAGSVGFPIVGGAVGGYDRTDDFLLARLTFHRRFVPA